MPAMETFITPEGVPLEYMFEEISDEEAEELERQAAENAAPEHGEL